MERGVWRAARRTGDLGPSRPIVVGVPALVAIAFALLANPHPAMLLVTTDVEGIREPDYMVMDAGVLSVRTVWVGCNLALAGWLGVCAAGQALELRQRGRHSRIALGQVVGCAGLLLLAILSCAQAIASPTRADWVREVRRDLARGDTGRLVGGLLYGQRVLMPLAHELFENSERDKRILGAAALWELGDRSSRVRRTIWREVEKVRQEGVLARDASQKTVRAMVAVARLIPDDRPLPNLHWEVVHSGDALPGGAYFWAWWARYGDEFR